MQGRPSFGKAWHYNKGLRESGWLCSPTTEDASGGERIATAWMALSLLLPRYSLFRQKQAFQPASFISICELSLRPKQRNALLAKISGKNPLIYLNLAIFPGKSLPGPRPAAQSLAKNSANKGIRKDGKIGKATGKQE
jgi:hypothetical protein